MQKKDADSHGVPPGGDREEVNTHSRLDSVNGRDRIDTWTHGQSSAGYFNQPNRYSERDITEGRSVCSETLRYP
jgi:hypothetical protein